MEHKKSKKQTVYRVQALDRALDILDAFSFQRRRMHLSEAVVQTGLKKTTCKRLMANLTHRGYLKWDAQTKQYELGLRLFRLGSVVHSSFSIRKVAISHIEWLRDQTGLTVLLGQCLEDRLVYVDKREGAGMIKISSSIGEQKPPHFGMLGQMLMAGLDAEKIQWLLDNYPLEPFTADSITEPERFRQRLAEIRQNDFAIETGEAHPGIMGLATPIRDVSHKVVAALGVAIPFPDYACADQVDRTLDWVRQASENISTELGCH
ncbi:IclR family transcriptional regulator [Desulfosarcina ovata]|uniref:IclR family transcriptional regulator n=1 Tax=Desulfosarcina ovata subsp. ovata TaxID=2752305 RepID=A0A5K8A8D3_9BACT|nr:IclR family transcriptional regulator [Desulfosarcina ovata]BBO88726.1 IclR family transcriptional regulator [Desulfosarcina ovata subsp. ovata]